jgi:hypothetical protein
MTVIAEVSDERRWKSPVAGENVPERSIVYARPQAGIAILGATL